MRARLPHRLSEFIMFGLKQAWACLFGGILLALIIATSLIWQDSWFLARYDFLFIAAVAIQILFLKFRLESWDEAKVILLFHISGTVMEIFKLKMGSWSYPEPGLIKIADVPLFSGFMYASVGSFMARVIRIFNMRFQKYPSFPLTLILALAIYLNFFTHHFIWDARWLLIAGTVLLYKDTRITFQIGERTYWMPLILAAFLSAIFLYLAENIGTLTGTWIYHGNKTWHFAHPSKFGSWYMLLFVSFVQVTLIFRETLESKKHDPR